jgi:uncharacterized repeat protein (TIGR02543 family)
MKTRQLNPFVFVVIIALLVLLAPSSAPPTAAQAQPPLDIWRMGNFPTVPLASATQVAAGGSHTCALTTSGGVKCWGDNWAGQLGDGTTTQRITPVDVSGLSSGVIAVAAGSAHTCALTASGGVKCWGWNWYGQLGDNTTTERHTPVDVSGLTSGVTAIAAGGLHTCALTVSGSVKCWGDNYYGQLGDSTTAQHNTPVDVSGLTSGVVAITTSGVENTVGALHTCALTAGGGVKCWGYNADGELGDDTTTQRNTPVNVSGLTSGVTAIAVGARHTCALTASSGVKCWGMNNVGQLGDDTTTQRNTPVNVSGLTSGVTAIAAGGYHNCALTASSVNCWGWNVSGQLGDGTTTDRHAPVNVIGLIDGVTAIALGEGHTCALTTRGGIKCWGWNNYAQLGDGTTTQRNTPVDVVGFGGSTTYSISGRVADSSSNPISGVTISDGAGHTATSDSNGYYALGGLAAGAYTITPTRSGYTFSPASRNVTVPPNAMSQNFTGTLTSACYTLTTTVQPTGAGGITRPIGNCNGGAGYSAGTIVRLGTFPSPGYRFVGWSGDASGTSATVNVTMTGNKSVTANFAQASPSQKPVVVLVHGWGGPSFMPGWTDSCNRNTVADHATDINNIPAWASNYFGVIARQLLNDGMDVWFAHLNSGPGKTPIIEENAECLKWQLADIRSKTGVKQVVLIGHSMGGLVSRAYIEYPVVNFYAGDVSRLITLGSPHTGTTGATFLALFGITCTANDPASCQFSTLGIDYFNQSYSTRAPQVTYNLIGGNLTPLLFGLPLSITDGPNDGAVGANSAMGRRYRSRPFQPPVIETVIGGSNVTRYAIGAAHGNFPTWHPNYFYTQQNDTTTLTETYQCIRQLLGISGVSCPAPAAMPVQPRTPKTSAVSQTPTFSSRLFTGQVATHTVPIDTSGFSQFNLTWITGTVGFTLRNPLGTVIDPAYVAAHPAQVTYTENVTDPNFPLFATYSFTTTVPGTYTLTITASDVGASGADYAASALVDSPRALAVTTDSTLYAVGSTATITATVQNAGTGLTGATVQAQLYRTGVVTDTVTLTDQGGGNYRGTYTIPNVAGYLGLSVVAQGNDAGTDYARQVDTLLAISSPTVQLTGQYADNAVDSDSNGKLDTLYLAIGVNSTQAGNYLLSGDLVGAGNVVVAHGVISTTLTTGTITVTLPFNGDDIRRSGLNGPYTLTNLTVTDQQNDGVPAVWRAANVYTTSAYNASDFAATCYVLTTIPLGGGSISANPSPNCNGGLQYASGTPVTLTAMPNLGYSFNNWSGDASGSSNPVPVTMNEDKTVMANFAGSGLYLPIILR